MNWQKQTDKPLFSDLVWSRPENKRQAGKLLVIGGQAGEFAHVAKAFEAANRAGAGHIRVLLPESLRKFAQVIPEVEFAPSNHSGSFKKTALAAWFDLAEWADHVLLAGDFGKNSETTTILDGFLLRGGHSITLNLNSLSSVGIALDQLANMPVVLVIDRDILQKLGIALGLKVAVQSTTPTSRLAEIIYEVSFNKKASFVIQDEDRVWAAVNGEVISTNSKQIDNSELSAVCAVWLLQNPKRPLEALATACFAAGSPSAL